MLTPAQTAHASRIDRVNRAKEASFGNWLPVILEDERERMVFLNGELEDYTFSLATFERDIAQWEEELRQAREQAAAGAKGKRRKAAA